MVPSTKPSRPSLEVLAFAYDDTFDVVNTSDECEGVGWPDALPSVGVVVVRTTCGSDQS